MICSKCKKQIDDDSLFCEHCGNRVSNVVSVDDSKLGVGLSIFSFLFPIVGFILYFVYKNSAYIKAKRAVKLAWIGFSINILLLLFRCDLFKQDEVRDDVIKLEEKVQFKGTHNGHEWVDLGLSVKWATCNVGASIPEGYGNYYAWGETTTKRSYSSSTYTYSINSTTLPLNSDAAAVNMGGSWRMPTTAEQDELRTECTWTRTTSNNVSGYTVTGPNGNSIFLPAAGFRSNSGLYYAGSYGNYWSSSLGTDDSNYAYGLVFDSDDVSWGSYDRFYGLSVRGVLP